jgi:hypothetical protein
LGVNNLNEIAEGSLTSNKETNVTASSSIDKKVQNKNEDNIDSGDRSVPAEKRKNI